MTPGPAPNHPNGYHIVVGGGGGGGSGSVGPGGYILGGGGGGRVYVNNNYFTNFTSSSTTQHYPEPASWEPWFAWRPVKVEDSWCWLTRVYRKKEYYDLENITEPIKFNWIYGTIFDVLREEQDGTN